MEGAEDGECEDHPVLKQMSPKQPDKKRKSDE